MQGAFSITKEKILFYKEGILDGTYIFKVDELDKGHYTAVCTNVNDKIFSDIVTLHFSDIKVSD